MNPGKVISIKDLVVRVQFDEEGPSVGQVVEVGNGFATQLLVDHLEPGGVAFCLNIRTDRRIQRGMDVTNTGKGIEIPVGDVTIGRIFDALGQPLDGLAPLDEKDLEYRDILKIPARTSNFTSAKNEILETGIKVIDFFTPFVKGRKIGIIGGAGVGKTVLLWSLLITLLLVVMDYHTSQVLVSVSVKVTNYMTRFVLTTYLKVPVCFLVK